MDNFSFENNNDEEYFAYRDKQRSKSLLVRFIFKISGGKIHTIAVANYCLLTIALSFFILSGLVFWFGF